MFGQGHRTKPIKSHTETYPSPQDVFRKLISDCTEKETWTHFDDSNDSFWVETSLDADAILVNFSFPFKQNIYDLFAQNNISIPGDWETVTFVEKGVYSDGYATFSITVPSAEPIVAFINQLFTAFSKAGPDYKVSGNIQG